MGEQDLRDHAGAVVEVAGLVHDGGGDGEDGGEEAASYLVDIEGVARAAYAGVSMEDFLRYLSIDGGRNLLGCCLS